MLRPAMTVAVLGWCLLYFRTKHAHADAPFAGRAFDPTDPNTGPNGRSQLAPLPDADAASTPQVSANDIKVTARRSVCSYIVMNALMLASLEGTVSTPPANRVAWVHCDHLAPTRHPHDGVT